MTREEAKKRIKKLLRWYIKEEPMSETMYMREAVNMATEALSAEPQTAEWILGGYDDMYYVCSKCNAKVSEYYRKPRFKYCPICGAKIKGDEA